MNEASLGCGERLCLKQGEECDGLRTERSCNNGARDAEPQAKKCRQTLERGR